MRQRMRSIILVAVMALVVGLGTAHAAADPEPSTRAFVRVIVLVRHGNYTPDPKVDPKLGPPLNSIGVAQANLTGARLAELGEHFDTLYVSPMQRARDTAAVIARDLPDSTFKVDDDLAECIPPTWRTNITKDLKPAELAACKARLDRVFARYFWPSNGHAKNVLLVCHGDVIRYLVMRALGVDTRSWLEMSVRNASITRIGVEAGGRFKVIEVGEDGFMPRSMLTGATGDPDRSLSVPPLPLDSSH